MARILEFEDWFRKEKGQTVTDCKDKMICLEMSEEKLYNEMEAAREEYEDYVDDMNEAERMEDEAEAYHRQEANYSCNQFQEFDY